MMSSDSPEPPLFPPVRDIRARRPRPDAESARLAYLDLLKLSLCDLAGAGTKLVRWTEDGRLFFRAPVDETEIRWRVDGFDWPLNGLTMIGLHRLDDLQGCVESLVRDGVPGDLIEAGTWRGGASMLMRATLDSLGADERTVCLADSFQGFPVPDPEEGDFELERQMSTIDFLAPKLEDVRGYFAKFALEHGVEFVPGFFEETMATLQDRHWSLIRLDADSYRATRLTLEALYPRLAVGGYLIIDDYFLDKCREAVDDFRSEHGITEPLEFVDWTTRRWRRVSEKPVKIRRRRGGPGADAPPRTPVQRAWKPVVAESELALQDRVEGLQARVRDLEEQLRLAGATVALASDDPDQHPR